MDLKDLVVSPRAIAQDKVAAALHGLVSIVEGTGQVIPGTGVGKLDGSTKVIVYLVGLRAAEILGFRTTAAATADEIATSMGLDAQRTRECLSRFKGKFVEKTSNGFEVPLPRVAIVCEEIVKKRGGSK